MRGKIRRTKDATIGCDGKPIKKIIKPEHKSQGIYAPVPRENLGNGCYMSRKLNGAP